MNDEGVNSFHFGNMLLHFECTCVQFWRGRINSLFICVLCPCLSSFLSFFSSFSFSFYLVGGSAEDVAVCWGVEDARQGETQLGKRKMKNYDHKAPDAILER